MAVARLLLPRRGRGRATRNIRRRAGPVPARATSAPGGDGGGGCANVLSSRGTDAARMRVKRKQMGKNSKGKGACGVWREEIFIYLCYVWATIGEWEQED